MEANKTLSAVDVQFLRGIDQTCWDCQWSLGTYDGLHCTLWDTPAMGICSRWAYEPGCDAGEP